MPSGAALGAEVHGVDLGLLDDDTFDSIRRAWLDHQVLLIRDQQLSDDELIAFSRRFGELDEAPIQENGRRFVDGRPEIYVVSNVVENGVAIGSLGSGEAVWHTDMSYLVDPPKASVLYALEVPSSGGDTGFCTMYGAWNALPAPLQRRIEGLRVKHDGTYNSGGYVREGVTPSDDPRTAPGALHPLVCTHADTRPARSVPGTPSQRVHRGPAARRVRHNPRSRLGTCHSDGSHLVPPLAGRRSGHVGQSLHDAQAQCLRRRHSPRDAPDADQERHTAARLIEFPSVSPLLEIAPRTTNVRTHEPTYSGSLFRALVLCGLIQISPS